MNQDKQQERDPVAVEQAKQAQAMFELDKKEPPNPPQPKAEQSG